MLFFSFHLVLLSSCHGYATISQKSWFKTVINVFSDIQLGYFFRLLSMYHHFGPKFRLHMAKLACAVVRCHVTNMMSAIPVCFGTCDQSRTHNAPVTVIKTRDITSLYIFLHVFITLLSALINVLNSRKMKMSIPLTYNSTMS